MNLRSLILRIVPRPVKNFLRQQTLPRKVSRLLSPYMPPVVCVDVGASYYTHGKWLAFLESPATQWLAVEPNKANISYIDTWQWACQVSTCTTGLSRDGGEHTLYVTNVDSGSSLLPPEIPEAMKHRVKNLDYFFPVTEHRIATLTLPQALRDMPKDAPVFVKLDTQGTELSILQGAQDLFNAHQIIGIEMESTLLAQPVMKGSAKFWQACEYLEGQGLELLHIKPISVVGRSGKSKSGRNTYLNECDAVYAIRRDIAARLPVEYRAGLLAFYITNHFFEEALALLEDDSDLCSALAQKGCPVPRLRGTLEAVV